MGKKRSKPLSIGNSYGFRNPDIGTYVGISTHSNEDLRFHITVGESTCFFSLTREEAAQLARNIFSLLDDTEPEVKE